MAVAPEGARLQHVGALFEDHSPRKHVVFIMYCGQHLYISKLLAQSARQRRSDSGASLHGAQRARLQGSLLPDQV